MLHFLYSKEEDVDYLAAAGNDRQKKNELYVLPDVYSAI